MGTFDQLIDKLDADDRVKGHQFERIAKWFLINDPTYINRGGPTHMPARRWQSFTGAFPDQIAVAATVSVVGEKQDREKLIDAALDLCTRQRYEATTIDQIAAAAGVTSAAAARYFATKDAIIMSIVEDILAAVAAELADVPPQTRPQEALLAANTAVLADITNSVGVIARERLQALAHILTASPELEKKATALGKQLLSVALAERMGVGPEDRRVRLAVTIRAAVIAGAYNAERDVRARIDPLNDGRVLERMVDRLNEAFTQVTGWEPPPPNRPSR